MKKFIGVQLALFFISAGVLYLYASNVFGKDKVIKKDISELTADEACILWKTVNSLENLPFDTEKENTEYLGNAIGRLMRLAAPYDELYILVSQLADERLKQTMPPKDFDDEDNVSEFKRIKGEILETLNPILNVESCEKVEMMVKVGWLTRAKLNMIQAINRLYYYLFGTMQEQPVDEGEITQQ